MARLYVDEGGYQYKKKRSRSKYYGTSSEPTVKRPKFSKELRMERIQEIHEELKTVDKRIDIKKKLLDQKVGEHKFGECDKISERGECTFRPTHFSHHKYEKGVVIFKLQSSGI